MKLNKILVLLCALILMATAVSAAQVYLNIGGAYLLGDKKIILSSVLSDKAIITVNDWSAGGYPVVTDAIARGTSKIVNGISATADTININAESYSNSGALISLTRATTIPKPNPECSAKLLTANPAGPVSLSPSGNNYIYSPIGKYYIFGGKEVFLRSILSSVPSTGAVITITDWPTGGYHEVTDVIGQGSSKILNGISVTVDSININTAEPGKNTASISLSTSPECLQAAEQPATGPVTPPSGGGGGTGGTATPSATEEPTPEEVTQAVEAATGTDMPPEVEQAVNDEASDANSAAFALAKLLVMEKAAKKVRITKAYQANKATMEPLLKNIEDQLTVLKSIAGIKLRIRVAELAKAKGVALKSTKAGVIINVFRTTGNFFKTMAVNLIAPSGSGGPGTRAPVTMPATGGGPGTRAPIATSNGSGGPGIGVPNNEADQGQIKALENQLNLLAKNPIFANNRGAQATIAKIKEDIAKLEDIIAGKKPAAPARSVFTLFRR